MTVRELRTLLETVPQDAQVFVEHCPTPGAEVSVKVAVMVRDETPPAVLIAYDADA